MDKDAEIARLTAALEKAEKALTNVRSIIAEAALTGFNYADGNWAERLFESQQQTSKALAALRSSAPAEGDYVLVPREPTREMVAAAFEARDHVGNALSRAAEGGFSSGVMCIYAAMIAAAPTTKRED